VTYKLTIDQKPAYLHVVVTGRNSGENVVRYMEEVIRECTARRLLQGAD
jgi:ATP:corrinoid adenosyltransferase